SVNIGEDWYLHGEGVAKNFYFTPWEHGYSKVTLEMRLALLDAAGVQALMGLLQTVITDYAEPAANCAHFLVDTAVSATFRARTYQAAEEETDTLVALDTDFHVFKIIWSRTNVLFYIDDVLVATHATQVPVPSLFIELVVRSLAGGVRAIDIDYIYAEMS
ncbi:unnamed protein product, partial [marine sediment metagenome]